MQSNVGARFFFIGWLGTPVVLKPMKSSSTLQGMEGPFELEHVGMKINLT